MVRLLQIVGVGALIVAGIVLVSVNPWRPLGLFNLGISQDPKAGEFIQSPGAVNVFNESRDSQPSNGQEQDPPLVQQAKTLESILNPRVPETGPAQAPVTSRKDTPVVKPPASTAKFDVVGISYLASDPVNSFAYIRLPDNSYQWIRQGSEVGHLTVAEVKVDSIVCSDGKEIKVESTVATGSILEGGAAVISEPETPGVLKGKLVSPGTRPSLHSPLSSRITAGRAPASTPLNAEDEANLNELVQRLKEINAAKAGQADSNGASAEMDKLISEAKASRMSPEEAQKLDKLGEELDKANNLPPEEKRREAMRRVGPPPRPPKP